MIKYESVFRLNAQICNNISSLDGRLNKLTLAKWLRSHLDEDHLKQNELARKLKLSSGTLTAIMRYGHVPSADIVKQLAFFFEDDPDTVLEIAGIVKLSDAPGELPPRLRGVVRRIYRLPEDDQEALMHQVEGLLQILESRGPYTTNRDEPPDEPQ
jgi:transcriptional regulator with XRE-family HTH domain